MLPKNLSDFPITLRFNFSPHGGNKTILHIGTSPTRLKLNHLVEIVSKLSGFGSAFTLRKEGFRNGGIDEREDEGTGRGETVWYKIP